MSLPLGTVVDPAHRPIPDARLHRCDDSCVCPLDGLPLIYAPGADQHACQLADCENAHGLFSEFGGFRWAV